MADENERHVFTVEISRGERIAGCTCGKLAGVPVPTDLDVLSLLRSHLDMGESP